VVLGLLAFVGPNQGGFADNDIGPQIFQTGCLIGNAHPCFSKVSLLMIIAAIVVIALFLVAFHAPQVVPRALQNGMEAVVDFVRNAIVMEVMGAEGLRWVPFLTAMFAYIFVCNVMEIIPLINFPPTSRIAIPLFLAIVVWFSFNVVGFKEQGVGYLKSTLFPPGVPAALYILVTPIEFVSTFLVRPFSLSVRLMGNMFAGHLILTIFALGTAYLLLKPATFAFAPFSFALSVFLTAFELLVAVLQAYIFTILTAVYIGGSMHAEH